MIRIRHLVLVALALAAARLHAQAAVPVIPVQRDTLANGLTLLLSPDHHAPIVGVTVLYHVGSKNEVRGRTGFAHLFEHVMFQGSAHVAKGEHIKTIEDAGGRFNGQTQTDQTTYWETVPVNYLATALWLEADRMGFLLPALTQEKLDNQRDVVKNERRERVDNQPFGSANEVMGAALFPASNPYSWPVIGSMADVSAASLDDVRAFFRKYYAPNNAVIAIVGDIDTAATRALVEKYFGGIPRGAAIERPLVAPTIRTTEQRLVLQDAKGTQPGIELAWPTVGQRSPDAPALDALGSVLTQDRTSRLKKVLMYDRQLASGVGAGQESLEDAGYFSISVTPRPGVSLTTIEQVTDSVLATLTTAPPTEAEVGRFKHYELIGTVLGLEGVQSRAGALAEGQTYYGDPEHYAVGLRESQAVTAADVERVTTQYLTAGRVVLSMVPAKKLDLASRSERPYTNVTGKTGAETTDAGTAVARAPSSAKPLPAAETDAPRPVVGPAPAVTIPKIETRTLENGVTVEVLENHALPVVTVQVSIRTSDRLDPAGKQGLGGMTAQMLGEGTNAMSAEQLLQAEADLGNGVGAMGFVTITPNVDRSLGLMADQLLHPAFPQASLDRIKANTVAGLKRAVDQPGYHAVRVLVNALYGVGHPYTRMTTPTSVEAITRDDLVAFHQDYYRPRNATFIVAGDITPDSAVAKLNRAFGAWEKGGKSGDVPVAAPATRSTTQIYLYDRPGAPQSIVIAAELGPRQDSKDYYALVLASTVLGGAFNSRINLDLREAHGYTYGASGGFNWREVPEPSSFSASASVATPKTDSALVDMIGDIRAFVTTRPVVDTELAFAKRTATLGLPLKFATTLGVASAARSLLAFHLPLDYYDHLSANYEAVTVEQARAAAARVIDPNRLVIIVEGDRKAIEATLRAAKIAPVVVVDDSARAVATQ